jgi:steroid delta-isomerase-like uncharacterized protein
MDHTSSINRLYDLINAGDIDGFGRQLADDFVERDEIPGLPPTKDGVIQYFRIMLAAFPDMRMDVQDSFASGEKAVARLRVSGTHQGEFMGIPATGKPVSVNLIDITRFGDDGLAREHWGVVDMLAMMQQSLAASFLPSIAFALRALRVAPLPPLSHAAAQAGLLGQFGRRTTKTNLSPFWSNPCRQKMKAQSKSSLNYRPNQASGLSSSICSRVWRRIMDRANPVF